MRNIPQWGSPHRYRGNPQKAEAENQNNLYANLVVVRLLWVAVGLSYPTGQDV